MHHSSHLQAMSVSAWACMEGPSKDIQHLSCFCPSSQLLVRQVGMSRACGIGQCSRFEAAIAQHKEVCNGPILTNATCMQRPITPHRRVEQEQGRGLIGFHRNTCQFCVSQLLKKCSITQPCNAFTIWPAPEAAIAEQKELCSRGMFQTTACVCRG